MTFSYECYTMVSMRRILFSFLMLAILTPTLICGTGICMKSAQAALPSCHDEQADNMPGGVMFMKDCMNIDLQTVNDAVSVQKPDHKIDRVVYDWASEMISSSVQQTGNGTIRGPPDRENIRNTGPSLILTTQRFRI